MKTWADMVKQPVINEPKKDIIKTPPNELLLETEWKLWSRKLHDHSWSISSFDFICQLKTVEDLCSIINVFNDFDLNKRQYFVMRSGIMPIWEDDSNKNGTLCKLKVETSKSFDVWSEILMHMMGETMNGLSKSINGASFCLRNNWVTINIWFADKNQSLADRFYDKIYVKYCNYAMRFEDISI